MCARKARQRGRRSREHSDDLRHGGRCVGARAETCLRTLGSVQHNAHFRQFRRGPLNATTPQHGSRYRMDEVLEALIAAPMQTAAPLAITLTHSPTHSLTHSLTHPLTHSLAPLALAPAPWAWPCCGELRTDSAESTFGKNSYIEVWCNFDNFVSRSAVDAQLLIQASTVPGPRPPCRSRCRPTSASPLGTSRA
jgi:hypothetical protein